MCYNKFKMNIGENTMIDKIHTCTMLSVDKGFKELLDKFIIYGEDIVIGKIHSIFKKTINFNDVNMKMYTIMREDLDNGPYSMRIKNDFVDFTDLDISISDSIVIKDRQLFIGDALVIKLDMCKIWEAPKLSIYPEKDTLLIFRKNLERYNDSLILKGTYGGGKYPYIKIYTSLIQKYQPSFIEVELEKRIYKLMQSLDNEDTFLEESIKALIGLGSGLTPSSDDILAGLIISLSMVKSSKSKLAFNRIKEILTKIPTSTTDVSIAMLAASLEGMGRETVFRFIDELCSSDIQDDTIADIFSIGSSSGTDMSVGIIMGLIYGLGL